MSNRIWWLGANVAGAVILITWSAAAQAPATSNETGGGPPAATMAPSPPHNSTSPTKAASEASGAAAVIPQRDSNHLTAKKLIGNNVVSKDGVEVGKVQDLILDRDGKVAGVVIATGGFLGIGSKPVGISSSAIDMRASKEQDVVFVNMNSNEIKEAPALKGDDERAQTNRERRSPGGGLGGTPGGLGSGSRTGAGGGSPGQ